MAVEDAEFGSLKLPTTLSVGALQAARSLNLPCGGHRGLSFSGPGSVPASAPQAHLSPSGAWGPFLHRSEACRPSFRVGVARLNVAPPVASRFRHFSGGELVRPNVIVKPLFKLKFEKGDLGE